MGKTGGKVDIGVPECRGGALAEMTQYREKPKAYCAFRDRETTKYEQVQGMLRRTKLLMKRERNFYIKRKFEKNSQMDEEQEMKSTNMALVHSRSSSRNSP